MYERVLRRFRQRIRQRAYIVTGHADEEMAEDDLSVYDLESAVLSSAIVERRHDRLTREWKYCVSGPCLSGSVINVVGKLSPTQRLVIITVFRV